MMLTKYSLLPKSTSPRSNKSPIQAKTSALFWRWHGQKYRSEHTPFHVSIIYFLIWGSALPEPFPGGDGYPSPHLPSHPRSCSHQAFWICPYVPRIPAKFATLRRGAHGLRVQGLGTSRYDHPEFHNRDDKVPM